MIIMATEYSAEWVKVPDGNGGTKKVWLRDSKARREVADNATKIAALESMVHHGTIATGTDLNTITTPGAYLLNGTYSYTNSPSSYGILEVVQPSTGSTIKLQRITTVSNVFFRYYSGSWRGWYKIAATAV